MAMNRAKFSKEEGVVWLMAETPISLNKKIIFTFRADDTSESIKVKSSRFALEQLRYCRGEGGV